MNLEREERARDVMGDGIQSEGTREKLLDVAIHLFYQNGVHATGLDMILKAVGTTKTTFYKYFESKDDLVFEALRRRDAWELEWFHNAVSSVDTSIPSSALLAVFDVLNVWFTDSRFQSFQFLNTAVQYPQKTDPIRELARKHTSAIRTLLLDTAKAAGIRDAHRVSRQLLLLVEGAITVRLVLGDDSAAKTGRELAELAVRHSYGE